ncbi:MAG: hypothetical protein IJ272_07690 [Clostridia bacterium]|nr:hypothetical protein [Clostridia bacterium]
MTKNVKMNKIFVASVAITLMFSIVGVGIISSIKSNASDNVNLDIASENTESSSTTNELAYDAYQSFIESVEEKGIITIENNQYTYDKEALKNEYDAHKIEELCEDTNGFSDIIDSINNLNANLSNGNMVIMPDDSAMKTSDVTLITRGGKTYDKDFWWGRRRYKSTAAAKEWVHVLNKAAAGEAGLGVIGSIFGPAPAVVGGLASAYCWMLAEDVSYQNSKTKKGIKADIPWVFVGYKVTKQG